MRYVAADVDGTVTRVNISFAFGRYLYAHGMISLFQALGAVVRYCAHRLGFFDVRKMHIAIFRSLFAKRQKMCIEKAADDFFAKEVNALLRQDVCRMVSEYKVDSKVALLSSSPDFLIERMAQFLGIEEWYATEYLVDSKGSFSEVGRVLTGDEKARIIRKVREEGDEVIAISDSMTDLPFLCEANCAIVVAPYRTLRRFAEKKKWRIWRG